MVTYVDHLDVDEDILSDPSFTMPGKRRNAVRRVRYCAKKLSRKVVRAACGDVRRRLVEVRRSRGGTLLAGLR